MQDDFLLAVYGDGLHLAHVLQLALREACLEATDAVQLSALALLHDVGDDLGQLREHGDDVRLLHRAVLLDAVGYLVSRHRLPDYGLCVPLPALAGI